MASNSREKIMEAIRKNKPAVKMELPDIPLFSSGNADLHADFERMVKAAGGNLIKLGENDHLAEVIKGAFPNEKSIISASQLFEGNVDWQDYTHPRMLNNIDLAVMEGQMGVAENGAVFVMETKMKQRVLPFITQHLVLILEQSRIVGNMIEAYQKVQIGQDGFSVFIAGPSKTADIEQSLVIGAQGARSFTVIIV